MKIGFVAKKLHRFDYRKNEDKYKLECLKMEAFSYVGYSLSFWCLCVLYRDTDSLRIRLVSLNLKKQNEFGDSEIS